MCPPAVSIDYTSPLYLFVFRVNFKRPFHMPVARVCCTFPLHTHHIHPLRVSVCRGSSMRPLNQSVGIIRCMCPLDVSVSRIHSTRWLVMSVCYTHVLHESFCVFVFRILAHVESPLHMSCFCVCCTRMFRRVWPANKENYNNQQQTTKDTATTPPPPPPPPQVAATQ